MTICGPRERDRAPGSVGRPFPAVEVRILGPDGAPIPVGRTGRIAVRSPLLVERYLGDARATAEAFRDGLFVTGDLGHVDAGGHLFVADRDADVISTRGGAVLPSEAEDVLRRDPYVLDAAAVAVSGSDRLAAAVEPRAGARPDPERLLCRCPRWPPTRSPRA